MVFLRNESVRRPCSNRKKSNRAFMFALVLQGAAGLAVLQAASATGTTFSTNKALDVKRQPHFTGIWVKKGGVLDVGAPAFTAFVSSKLSEAPVYREPPPLKPEYAAKALPEQTVDAAVARGDKSKDYGAMCLPQGMPDVMDFPFAMEILQTSGQVTMVSEFQSEIRRIYTDGRRHPSPDDLNPSYSGHSIGHWEGDTLVVDTVGVKTKSIARMPYSDRLHITERIRLQGPNTLDDQMVIEDPEVLSGVWHAEFLYARRAGMEMMQYVCEENNRDK